MSDYWPITFLTPSGPKEYVLRERNGDAMMPRSFLYPDDDTIGPETGNGVCDLVHAEVWPEDETGEYRDVVLVRTESGWIERPDSPTTIGN